MAEIKTCEQYVLAELEQLKWDKDSLAKINGQLDAKIGELLDETEFIRDAVKHLFYPNGQIKSTIDIDDNSYNILRDFAKGE